MPAFCIILTVGAEYLTSEERLFSSVLFCDPRFLKPLRQKLLPCGLCCWRCVYVLEGKHLILRAWQPKAALLQAADLIWYKMVTSENKYRVKDSYGGEKLD